MLYGSTLGVSRFFLVSASLVFALGTASNANTKQTHDAVVGELAATAQRLQFDTKKYTAMLDSTAAGLIDKNPGLGTNIPIWVLPSRPYPEMYSRDSFWTLAGYWHGNYLNTYVDIFSKNSQDAAWQPPLAGQIPTFVRKHVANPQDGRRFDESTMFWVLGAKLTGKTVATEPYLKQAHAFLKTLVTPQGYAMVSHGWIDAWEPVSTPVISANNQGLYAVTLRALRDMGVDDVTKDEIKAADNAYRSLYQDGYLHAYLGTTVGANAVDTSSLMGEALALYLWDESILDDAMVTGTVAKFAPTYYEDGQYLGYKCLSNPDGSYLDEKQFWEIAERDPGNYQNGGSWLLYEALALYAAARHDTAPVYAEHFIQRLATEVRYEYSSKEFVCTGGHCGGCNTTGCYCPNGKCGAGAFNLGRSGYGWNLFVKRLLRGRDEFNAQQGD